MSFLLEKFDFLVSAVGQYVVEQWRDISHIDNHLDDLRGAIDKGHDLIIRSECWRSKHNSIQRLLPCLKDAVYEAESIVDELEYQRSKQTVEKNWPGESLVNYFKEWMNGFPERVKLVQKNLSEFCNEMQEACNEDNIPKNHNQFDKDARPTTTKYINTPKVYGRDEQLNEVIHLLGVSRSRSESGAITIKMNQNSSNFETGESSGSLRKEGNVNVISIVGMGGVGKTTFAQLIYNDTRVKSYFEKLIWICISDNFDVKRLLKEIIEHATKRKCDHTTLNDLKETLEETLKSERFLLVLDDAWSVKETDWKDLLDPIRKGIKGSTILVTTRSKKVAEMAANGMNFVVPIYLEGLEEKIYWEFFKSQAFDSEVETNFYAELEQIGKEICKKLKGSPLAAKTIGALLKRSLDVEHWCNIRDSEMWRLKQEEHHILPVLRLSYQYLPAPLKKRFSFCSLYPKDFKFTKAELFKLWTMHDDFFNCSKDQKHDQQDIMAEVYFDELLSRCFFQKTAACHSNEYVIHDLMHDICQFMTEDECFCLEDGVSTDKKPISPNIRCLSIHQLNLHWGNQNELGKLLSMRVKVAYSQNDIFRKAIGIWCDKLTNVRSLSLAQCKIEELPENIGNLKHLKYLDISLSKIKKLPGSFCNLYNLMYLNMEGCFLHRNRFPVGSEKLVSMRFFHFPKSEMPLDGISINLAKTIIVKDMEFSLTDEGNQLQIFKHISTRGTLRISDLNNADSKDAAQEAELNRKSLINSLHFNWELDRTNTHDEVLEGLCPHSNIKELTNYKYGGEKLPSWLKNEFLPNLTELRFHSCVNLLTISHLPCRITNLSIVGCIKLTNVENCLRPEHLPALKHLYVRDCEKLMSLPVESFGRFESLENLKIFHCPKLTCPNAMVLPPSLKTLDMLGSCGDLENSIPSCMHNVPSLQSLNLDNLPLLVSIPAEVTSHLRSLSFLRVSNCAELQSLGGLQFLASVKDLLISRCPKLEETGGQDIFGKLSSELLANLSSPSRGRKRKARKARN